jgi:hypothetical protein
VKKGARVLWEEEGSMTPEVIVSLFDPVFWGVIWFVIWGAYRIPKWSWIKLPLAVLWLGGLGGIIVLQAHVWESLEPRGADRRIFDHVLFPEIIPGFVLMFWRAILEDRAKKGREMSRGDDAHEKDNK